MKHLAIGDFVWCDEDVIKDVVDDPRDAGCVECLRRAAEYGAAAAMRCAAIESGGSRDLDLERERDMAIRELQKHRDAVAEVGVFVCAECGRAFDKKRLAYSIGTQGWCDGCVTYPTRTR